jgi:Family of unknown function (DUF6444)
MSPTLPIPESLWNTVPPDAHAALQAVFESLRWRIAELEQRVADLQSRLRLNSTNSSKPPSSDPIGLKRKPHGRPGGSPAGNPGQVRAQRPLVPPDKLRSSTDCRPATCRRCAHPLRGDDPDPLIHQVTDLRLLGLSDRLFGAWQQARDGALEEWAFQQRILRLRPRVRRALEDGTRCSCATTARTCAEILRVEEGLWNFVWFPGVEPTNNAAERAWRHAVIWRRISGGTVSESGSRFVQRMLTVVATCRQRGRNLLEYLTSCFEADGRVQLIPSLLPVMEPAIKVA